MNLSKLTSALGFTPDTPILTELLNDLRRHHSKPCHQGLRKHDGASFDESVLHFLDKHGEYYWPSPVARRSHLLSNFHHVCPEDASLADPELKKRTGDILHYMATNYHNSRNRKQAKMEKNARIPPQPDLHSPSQRDGFLGSSTARTTEAPIASNDENSGAFSTSSSIPNERKENANLHASSPVASTTSQQKQQSSIKRERTLEADSDVTITAHSTVPFTSQEAPARASKVARVETVSVEPEREQSVNLETNVGQTENIEVLRKPTILSQAIVDGIVLRVFVVSQSAKGGTRIQLRKCSNFESFFAILIAECGFLGQTADVTDITVMYPWDASASLRMRNGNIDDWDEFCGDLERAWGLPDIFQNGKCYIDVNINM